MKSKILKISIFLMTLIFLSGNAMAINLPKTLKNLSESERGEELDKFIQLASDLKELSITMKKIGKTNRVTNSQRSTLTKLHKKYVGHPTPPPKGDLRKIMTYMANIVGEMEKFIRNYRHLTEDMIKWLPTESRKKGKSEEVIQKAISAMKKGILGMKDQEKELKRMERLLRKAGR